MYKKIDSLDKEIKPLIIKWLCNLFGYTDYVGDFRDQWITWGVWDGELNVGFDHRSDQHKKLLSLIHPRFLGAIQYSTLNVVNAKTFYLDLERMGDIKYPNIVSSTLLHKHENKGGKGGWSSPSDSFYSYEWEVFLDDGTSLYYRNQSETMDMVKGDYVYRSTIQERFFVEFLKKNY